MKKYKVLFADLDGTLIEMISGNTFPKGIWNMRVRFDVLDAKCLMWRIVNELLKSANL